MYAFVQGRLEDPGPPVVVSCGGLGFELHVPERSRLRLPPRGEELRLFTHLHAREDGMTLFGFARRAERDLFRDLIQVSGVGPKLALAILGDEDFEAILAGARAGDAGPLTRVKGVGKKTAERLVVELRDRDLGALQAPARVPVKAGPEEEAVLALEAMGLPGETARRAVAALPEAERVGLGVEEILRAALRRVMA
jgi:Holliday junction DNA helicase RuvA